MESSIVEKALNDIINANRKGFESLDNNKRKKAIDAIVAILQYMERLKEEEYGNPKNFWISKRKYDALVQYVKEKEEENEKLKAEIKKLKGVE